MSMLPFGNLSDLPKIVNNFVDKISHAAGIWWEPKQKVRLAEAEAKADLIREVGEIKVEAVKELAERAGKCIVYEELRKQSNMESIIDKAILAINEEAKPQDLQDDWIANFFDKCRLVSDEQMQVLWAKILAGERILPASSPRRRSILSPIWTSPMLKRSLDCVASCFWSVGLFEHSSMKNKVTYLHGQWH